MSLSITHVAIQYNGETYSLPKPYRHPDVIRMIHGGAKGPSKYGFLINGVKFVDRIEAMQIAKEHNLLLKPINSSELYSEDLW